MNLSSIFISNHPTLDLHGEISDIARVKINDFIRDNLKLKNNTIVIIHGIGSGILRKTTHDTLKRNKSVLSFGTHFMNSGCTVVHLKL